jgi:DNA polymerase
LIAFLSRGKIVPMTHSEIQRRAYLEAIGVDVWLPRDAVDGAVPAETARSVDDDLPQDWEALRATVAGCTRCELCKSRTQTVFGVGNRAADWMVIGEAPGAEEDRRGEPFIGRAGKLLDEMLRAIGQSRDTVFIANILKCRPPHNRDPELDEMAQCRAYLERQIALVQPRIILAVGRIAAQSLLGRSDALGRLRNQTYEHNGIPLVATYHPAYLLRSPSHKRQAWQDLCLAINLAAGTSA